MRFPRAVALTLAATSLPATVLAQVITSPELRVNTYTTGRQIVGHVSVEPDGEFVVAWTSEDDGSGYGTFAQRHRKNGQRLGGEFRVTVASWPAAGQATTARPSPSPATR